MLPIADAARATFPAVDLDEPDGRPRCASVVRSTWPCPAPGEHALFAPDGTFLALYEPTAADARPVAVFVG